MHPALLAGNPLDHLTDGIADPNPTEWDVAGGDGLGKLHNIWLDPVVFETKPASGTAKTGDHLICDQEHLVLVADLADTCKIVILGWNNPTGALYWLSDKSGYRLRSLV